MATQTALQKLQAIDQAITEHQAAISKYEQQKLRLGFEAICEHLGVQKGGRLRVTTKTPSTFPRTALYTIHPRKKGGATLRIVNRVWGMYEEQAIFYDELSRGFYDGETYDKIEVARPDETEEAITYTRFDITPELEAKSQHGIPTTKVRPYCWAEWIQRDGWRVRTGKIGKLRAEDTHYNAMLRLHEAYPSLTQSLIQLISPDEYDALTLAN